MSSLIPYHFAFIFHHAILTNNDEIFVPRNAFVVGLGALLVEPQANTNVIVNGNSETGSLSSWTSNGNVGLAGTKCSVSFDYGSYGGAQGQSGNMLASQLTSSTGIQGSLATFSFSVLLVTAQSLTLSFTDFAGKPTSSTDGTLDNLSVNVFP